MTYWVFTLILGIILTVISVSDYRSFRIPDRLSMALAVVGGAALFALQPEAVFTHGVSAVVGFGVLFIVGEIYFRSRGAEFLGIGDAKLFGGSLIWVGPLGAASVLLLACLGGIAYAVLRSVRVGFEAERPIPFAPFLCMATFIVWLGGPIWF